MNARVETRLWLAQRVSAAVLAACVCAHLVTLVVAVNGGLSASAILGRTRGSLGWAAFYGLFVLSVSVHAPIGLRTVAAEWLGWRGRAANVACSLIGLVLLVLGAGAVVAVTR